MEHQSNRNIPFHIQNGMETRTKLATMASKQVRLEFIHNPQNEGKMNIITSVASMIL